MAKRKKKKFSLRRLGIKIALILNLIAAGAGGVWYLLQPPPRQAEVRLLFHNCVREKKKITPIEFVWDLYTLYYSDQFVSSDFEGGEKPLYGGRPKKKDFPHSLRILKNEAYQVGYCDALKNPAWVAYRLFDVSGYVEIGKRPESFETDRRTIARVETGDYTGSGFDRGHLAPNFGIARCFGRKAQLETFLMSNITPQTHFLNAGIWKDLELRTAKNYTGRFQEIWVITGPLFQDDDPQMKSGIPIPQQFYKILVDEHEGRLRLQAFIMGQDDHGSLRKFLVSVDDIEARSGLDFFPKLDNEVEEKVEAAVASRAW